jgi:hypothetical protein
MDREVVCSDLVIFVKKKKSLPLHISAVVMLACCGVASPNQGKEVVRETDASLAERTQMKSNERRPDAAYDDKRCLMMGCDVDVCVMINIGYPCNRIRMTLRIVVA